MLPASRRVAIGLVLLGLLAANLLIDVCLVWLMERSFPGSSWFDQIPIGVLVSQLILMAMWVGLGDWRWYVRLVIAVPVTFCLAQTIGVASRLSSPSFNRYEPDPSPVVAFIFLAMMLAASCVAFILRRTWSWRLTWQDVKSAPAARQFALGDALLWMIVIGGSLAAIRFLISIDRDFPTQILDIALYTVKTAAVVVAAMLLVFSSRFQMRAVGIFVFVVLLIGAGFAVPDAYESVRQMRVMGTTRPLPTYRYLIAWANPTKKHEVYVIAAAVGAVANSLALRALGCKLIRPGQISPRRPAQVSQPAAWLS
jgi:hypothetical protein